MKYTNRVFLQFSRGVEPRTLHLGELTLFQLSHTARANSTCLHIFESDCIRRHFNDDCRRFDDVTDGRRNKSINRHLSNQVLILWWLKKIPIDSKTSNTKFDQHWNIFLPHWLCLNPTWVLTLSKILCQKGKKLRGGWFNSILSILNNF